MSELSPHPLLTQPVLIIGVGGMLYRAWAELLAARGVTFAGPPIAELDLTNPASVRKGVEERYRLVINCAAWTDVDGAESKSEEARRINGTGVGTLAARCRETGALLVHYSTDYVFAGDARSPYLTTEPRAPLSAYGRSKAEGEELLAASGCAYLLVRTSWLYAPWGKNFVRTIHRLAHERELVRVVNDQRGRPTSSEHLARTTLGLIEHDCRGIFHVTDGGECTWYDFAAEIARLSGAKARVEPCTSAAYPSPVKRPAYSVLDLSAVEQVLGPMPAWQENLAGVLRRLE